MIQIKRKEAVRRQIESKNNKRLICYFLICFLCYIDNSFSFVLSSNPRERRNDESLYNYVCLSIKQNGIIKYEYKKEKGKGIEKKQRNYLLKNLKECINKKLNDSQKLKVSDKKGKKSDVVNFQDVYNFYKRFSPLTTEQEFKDFLIEIYKIFDIHLNKKDNQFQSVEFNNDSFSNILSCLPVQPNQSIDEMKKDATINVVNNSLIVEDNEYSENGFITCQGKDY